MSVERVALYALLGFWVLMAAAFLGSLPMIWARRAEYESPAVGPIAIVLGLGLVAVCLAAAYATWGAL